MGRDEGWGGDTVRERGLDISARYLGIRVIAEGEGRGREIREYMGRRRWKAEAAAHSWGELGGVAMRADGNRQAKQGQGAAGVSSGGD